MACEIAIASVMSALLTRPLTQPLDVLKIRQQLDRNPSCRLPWTVQSLIRIAKNEGTLALWRGLLPSEVLIAGYGLVQFEVFELSAYALTHHLHISRRLSNSISGSVASISATFVTYPFDIARTRVIAKSDVMSARGSLTRAMCSLVHDEGVHQLWRGFTPTFLLVGVSGFVQFGSYSVLTQLLQPTTRVNDTFKTLVAGCMAGGLSKFVVYPLDVAKKRLQVQGCPIAIEQYGQIHPYNGLFGCIRTIVRQEGSKALFRRMLLQPNR